MSKAGKRLIVRLSIVTVIVGLGVFALVQAQIRDTRADQDDAENRIETPPVTSTSSTSEFTPPAQQPLRITPVNYNQKAQTNSQPHQYPPGPAAPGSRGGSVDLPASNAKLLPVNPTAETKPRPGLRSIAQFDPNSTPLPNQKYPPAAVPIPHTKNGKSGAGVSVRIGDNQEKVNSNVESTNESGKRDQFEGTRNIQYKGTLQFDGPKRPYEVEANANSNAAALKTFNPNDLRREPARAQIYDLASGATPGAQHLEGVRTPSLVLEKRAPEEIQVGKPAIFEIHVRNSGPVDAKNVTVLDQVPRGTRFVDASPVPQQSPDGQLLWQLGTLKPGDEKSISIQLIPTEEGEIGSVARIAFETEASVRTRCTRPQLAIEVNSSQRVLIGETMNYTVKISNPGTGDATGVILEEDVPEGFSHPAGNELEFELGTLRPGESREVKLTLKAEQAGLWENVMVVRADGNLVEQDAARTEVIAPQLSLTTRGPSKRYLERPAIY
ncbi:MAG: DUF11 domain-containing protein, partial [Planctomycetes bacterium]|nr:DUF11 domain-containing protein [Planctomycetota bacterium]